MVQVRCKVCDSGTLIQRKKYRMSGPVVFIGYILLIPSILGILFSAFMFFTAATTTNIDTSSGSNVAAGILGGFSIFMGIAALVSGLLGWLLIMKKQVLECDVCHAVVNAS